ncbi:nuclear mitotic apparatus protein 1-like isoform X3 [Python bivittatus]|uniref:Nuclear mitotic apparatus protein 1-like isoform X3 n=1 Tax=Python bivittatus TaxID=176946 RepID=A0A9F5N2B9_PYTBI|nr:nuclear mitotic apparatus protein 1-like isoform X3 [Python bivittatus]
MLLRKWSGFRSLPSRYGGIDGGFQHSSVDTRGSGLPSQEAENTRGSPASFSQSLSAAGLEKIGADNVLPSKIPSQLETNGTTAALELISPRSTPRGASMKSLHLGPLPRAGSASLQPGAQDNGNRMDVTRRMGYSMQPPSSSLRRRNSLSHLPNYNTKDFNSDQPLARKMWNGSQLDLQATFLEETQRNAKLREGASLLAGPPNNPGERNLELEVDMMEFELCSLKQKQMESSFIHLEKEKKWLEMIRSEGRKRKGELDDKIFKVEMELAKAKSYFGKRDRHLLSQGLKPKGNVIQEKLDVGHELRNLQESLAALKNCIKALEEKRDEMVQQLKCVKEGEQSSPSHQAAANSLETKQERSQLQAAYKNIKLENVVLHQQVQHLSLEVELAQTKQKEFSEQIFALKSELANSKTQVNQQEQEKVLMKEEMESVRQLNKELSSKVAEGHQRLQALLEKLHLLEEEKKFHANHIQALEDERTQLLEEKEQHLLERTAEQQCQEEAVKALQGSCENLRESQIQLQKEKDLLQAHCQELERQAEELGKQLGEQQSVSQHWRNRWEQADVTLKTTEEALEKMSSQSQALPAKVEAPLLLQIQLEACKQELELEQNCRQALHHQVQALQSGSQNSAKPTPEMFPEEADSDILVVQEELQKAWDLLKTREMVLEEQRLQLESARIQNTECNLERQRLEQHVHALEEQLAEKDKALRDLRQAKDVERAASEMRTSSELKITREGLGACYEKGHPCGLDAKVIGNPPQELEGLRLQHHLVTEQLKDLFRQRQQQQEGPRKHHDGGLKEKSSAASQNAPELLTTASESLGLPEESYLEFGGASRSEEAAQSLQQQLKAKTEMISAMACEIQALKEKNENLIKAKLRFQQQIQQIRQLSKRQPEKSPSELLVPRLSISPRDDLQSSHCNEMLAFSPQGGEAPFSSHGSRETQHAAVWEQWLQACSEDEQSGTSLNTRMVQKGPTPLPPDASHQPHGSLSDTSSPANKLLLAPMVSPKGPLSHAQGERALLSPCSSGLLSPKPFGAPRPWSPFRESAESPENRREL